MSGVTIHPVLLSGGAGTRLWPLSRRLYPKQFLPLAGDETLLQQTALRLRGDGFAPPIVISNAEHRFLVAEQLAVADVSSRAIVLEPVGRNTAPAAVIAALMVARDAPGDLVFLAPSDHVVREPDKMRSAIAAAAPAAANGAIVVFGVVPDRPHTGYGYILPSGERVAGDVQRVAQFIEKPDAAMAEGYFGDGRYLWNAGMFLFRAGTLIEEMERLHPEMVEGCRRALSAAASDLDFVRLEETAFAGLENISLDYALMERTAQAAVQPLEAGWSDVGSWQALWEAGAADDDGNVVAGNVVAHATCNNYLRSSGPMIAALGVEDLVVVATPDAVLVVPRALSENVRDIVERVGENGGNAHESHVEVNRPWGSFRGLHGGPGYQVKQLKVNPGAAISLQYHNQRAEHWVVVGGTARVRCGEDEIVLAANQSTYIPLGAEHRLENPGDEPLVVIEVQTGDYLGEDDIVRLEDRYGRD